MTEQQSIRDELSVLSYEHPDGYRAHLHSKAIDAILPLLNRLRAEALREAAAEARRNLGTEASGHTSTYSVRKWLSKRADTIEQNSEGRDNSTFFPTENPYRAAKGEHFHIWSELPCKAGECRMEPQGEQGDAS